LCDNNPPLFYLWCVLWLAGSAMTGAGYPKPKARICCGVASTEFGVVRHRKGGSVSVTSGVLVGVRVKDEHAKDAAQLRRALRRACHRTWRRTWASGPGRRAPSSPRHHRRRRRLCASRAEMTGQLSGIWLGLWASASGGAAQSASMLFRASPSVIPTVAVGAECIALRAV